MSSCPPGPVWGLNGWCAGSHRFPGAWYLVSMKCWRYSRYWTRKTPDDGTGLERLPGILNGYFCKDVRSRIPSVVDHRARIKLKQREDMDAKPDPTSPNPTICCHFRAAL